MIVDSRFVTKGFQRLIYAFAAKVWLSLVAIQLLPCARILVAYGSKVFEEEPHHMLNSGRSDFSCILSKVPPASMGAGDDVVGGKIDTVRQVTDAFFRSDSQDSFRPVC